jgi:hypothetical protein
MNTATENTTKAELQKIDDFHREKNSREESNFLSRISRIVLSAWDFSVMISRLSSGECLTVNSQGEVFQGKVNTDKLRAIPGKLPKFQQSEFDTAGFQEFCNSKSLVESPGNGFRSGWVNALKAPKNSQDSIAEMVNMKFQEIHPDEILEVNHVVGSHGEKFMEVTLKDYPIIPGIFEKTGTIYYYYFEGKKVDVR